METNRDDEPSSSVAGTTDVATEFEGSEVVVTVRIPVYEFLLPDLFERFSDVSVTVNPVAASNPGTHFRFVWITGIEPTQIDDGLADDPTVERFECRAANQHAYFYEMRWTATAITPLERYINGGGVVLDAVGRNSTWQLKIAFRSRTELSDVFGEDEREELNVEIRRIGDFGTRRNAGYQLTSEQREALVVAMNEGYFEIPRKATAKELAETLGISHQALSERLRRAHSTLIQNTLLRDFTEEI